MRIGIQNLIGENRDEVAERGFKPDHKIIRNGNTDGKNRTDGGHIVATFDGLEFFYTTKQIGVGFDDVQMGILRFGIVGIQFRKAHIGYLPPFAGAGFDVAVVFTVERMFLYAFIEFHDIVESLAVTCGTGIFRKPVDGEANGIELLLRVFRLAFIVKAPVSAAIFLIDEMVDDIVFGTSGSLQIFLLMEHPIGSRERP